MDFFYSYGCMIFAMLFVLIGGLIVAARAAYVDWTRPKARGLLVHRSRHYRTSTSRPTTTYSRTGYTQGYTPECQTILEQVERELLEEDQRKNK